jgi:hypothetical protein
MTPAVTDPNLFSFLKAIVTAKAITNNTPLKRTKVNHQTTPQ